ncbi:hypothetical protein K9N68_06650 [Kovacikia minuta CCNUW1]|uniref:hypothetical protein n=1 Tax=Kovacikia minuta TaxID=2931930 RepID=UPI001CCAE9C4|nr:hypothetical protein [Kovacikia minuta]UBF27598.1 hypothetical protein K9N68_06650 [Kovacikia minuta CCNUW1]
MPILLDYQNREVRLTEERLAHILDHPEMVGMEAQIADTLRQPKLVRQSRSDENIALLYQFYTQTVIGDKWLCVVVKYLPDDAFVVTAYFTDKPKKGETLWQNE